MRRFNALLEVLGTGTPHEVWNRGTMETPSEKPRAYLITGVSSGLGYALADECLQRGYSVWGLSRRVPEDLVQRGMVHQSIDLVDLKRLPQVLHSLLANVPELDVVLLNAATLGPFGDVSELAYEQVRATMETNVWANKAILDYLSNRSMPVNQVVVTSSGAGLDAKRGVAAYCLSKATLNMLVRLYALEWPEAHFSILLPGIVDTPMQSILAQQPVDERFPIVSELRHRREAGQMFDATVAARRIIQTIPQFPSLIASGELVHIHNLPELDEESIGQSETSLT